VNLTITGGVFTIALAGWRVPAVGAGGSQANGISKIEHLAVLGGRFNITMRGAGVCLGASASWSVSPGLSEVTEMVVDSTEVVCRGLTSNGFGIGAGIGRTICAIRVPLLTIRNSTISCSGLNASCVGSGPITDGVISQVSNLTVINSSITGSGIGGDLGFVRLESSTIKCDGEMESSCVSGGSLELAVNVKGETSTRRFFNAATIRFEKNPLVVVTYMNDSDEEGLRDFPSIHLRRIVPPFTGRYIVAPPKSRYFVAEMSGSENGLLLSTGGRVPAIEMWRISDRLFGGIMTNESRDIVVREGETLVDDPIFVWATMKFTSSLMPYKRSRRLIKMMANLYMLGAVQLQA
jgi:hypothetical protein